jgi:membrane-associated phospholipid phosphatase
MLRYLLLALIFISGSINAQKTFSEKSGDILSIALPAGAFISSFKFQSENSHFKDFALGFLCSELATQSLKRIIDKPRPNGGRFSFPSGHTSAAFYGATFLNQRFGLKVGVPSYLIASYVGYTRIKAKKHDIFDVIGGVTIGIASSYLFRNSFKNEANLKRLKADVSPVGFNVTYSL